MLGILLCNNLSRSSNKYGNALLPAKIDCWYRSGVTLIMSFYLAHKVWLSIQFKQWTGEKVLRDNWVCHILSGKVKSSQTKKPYTAREESRGLNVASDECGMAFPLLSELHEELGNDTWQTS